MCPTCHRLLSHLLATARGADPTAVVTARALWDLHTVRAHTAAVRAQADTDSGPPQRKRQGKRVRRTDAEVHAAQTRVDAERVTVIARYLAGEPLGTLAKTYGVGDRWLKTTFESWSVPLRSKRKRTP
ncbi:hypothetical protein [Streptomyces yaizuensis]|uniref:Helix-turn-helix DNA binding domain protein n=1 Tax=Streptomyces yaizuensis TaxID=2989713 RepID=A0ABQ5P9V0_9ACTN|nr:hypothetical protein [Streptomyces sp. YSPA8]GLF99373.1 hypothetical protein SYYSPA8_33770 [Streptomyces sp. YSPA8]